MSRSFLVYGQDAEQTGHSERDGKPVVRRVPRLVTHDFEEALRAFLDIVIEEEHGALEWSS